MKQFSRPNRGYTLIELLVVVNILGVLSAVAIPSYLSSAKTARANTANTSAKAISDAFQVYGLKNGTYGATPALSQVTADLGGSIPPNPCKGDVSSGTTASWTLTGSGSGPLAVTAVISGANCSASEVITFSKSL